MSKVDQILRDAESYSPPYGCASEMHPAVETLRELVPLLHAVVEWQSLDERTKATLCAGLFAMGHTDEQSQIALAVLREAWHVRF